MLKIINKIKEYFNKRTNEQIFSLCLLIGIVVLMLFCCIVRLCGGLWFTADLSKIQEPSKAWQEVIKGALLTFELVFVYKLLCRTKLWVCLVIAVCETCLGILLSYLLRNLEYNQTIVNIFYMVCVFTIPLPFVRQWFSLVDSAALYAMEMLYSFSFLVGRIGGLNLSGYNFIASIIGAIDFKLFVVSLFLTINYFGGIKLWKNQKRLILQKNLTKN